MALTDTEKNRFIRSLTLRPLTDHTLILQYTSFLKRYYRNRLSTESILQVYKRRMNYPIIPNKGLLLLVAHFSASYSKAYLNL